MRELTNCELEIVSGGIALGTGPTGIFSATNIAAGSRLVGGVGLIYTAGALGWNIGTWAYRNYIGPRFVY